MIQSELAPYMEPVVYGYGIVLDKLDSKANSVADPG